MVGQKPVRIWLEETKHLGMALGLTNTAKAVEALQLPASSFTTVHVAGSNGKGTTCAMLCTALTNQGVSNLLFPVFAALAAILLFVVALFCFSLRLLNRGVGIRT